MYRIWIGLDPKLVMAASGSAITVIVLVLHLTAFKALNWPGYITDQYNPAAASTR
jgi:hypothetical protein